MGSFGFERLLFKVFLLLGQLNPLALHLLAVELEELFLTVHQPLLTDELGLAIGNFLFLFFDSSLLLTDCRK